MLDDTFIFITFRLSVLYSSLPWPYGSTAAEEGDGGAYPDVLRVPSIRGT